jgi:thiamine-monophosphate kinase
VLVGNPGYLWAWAAAERLELPDVDRVRLYERARRPIAQLSAGRLLAERGLATAAVDVSDGLCAGVRLLAESNDLGAELTGGIELDPVVRKVCEQAGIDEFQLGQTWGDWSLLVTVRPDKVKATINALGRKDIAARPIGTLVDGHRDLLAAGQPWAGMDQERFSANSWQGDGVDKQLQLMIEQSRR